MATEPAAPVSIIVPAPSAMLLAAWTFANEPMAISLVPDAWAPAPTAMLRSPFASLLPMEMASKLVASEKEPIAILKVPLASAAPDPPPIATAPLPVA